MQLLLACLAVNVPAHAQSMADFDRITKTLELRIRALDASIRNVHQMEYHRDDLEANVAGYIVDEADRVIASAGEVLTVGFIAKGMRCPDDFRYAQGHFALVAGSFITTVDGNLEAVNRNLRSVTAPASLAEATKIRDLIVELRGIVKPFAKSATD